MNTIFKLKPGIFVRHQGERYIVVSLIDLESVLCRKLSSRETTKLLIVELERDSEKASKKRKEKIDLGAVNSEEWSLATKQMAQVKALFEMGRRQKTREEVEKIAKEFDRSLPTIYRWIAKFEKDSTVRTFLKEERIDKGSSRLVPEVEPIIAEAMKRLLMKQEFGTFGDVYLEVKQACIKQNIKAPSVSTIRNRFSQISEKERVSSRQGKKASKQRFMPTLGEFPGAEHPLDVIQIDHTPADIIIVDDVYRKPIGRPTLTIAIDVNSRVLMGFNLWLDAPSVASTGLCLMHALMPKDKWLKGLGIDISWPCYGRPRKIHTDNAKEFRGTVLGRACENYGIDLEQRPRGSPKHGGTVERSFRTYMRKIHAAPGTTFSNVKSKFEYDSEGKAIFTLKEFEYWFTLYITKIYHQKKHSGINTTPLARFQEGIGGTDDKPGIGELEIFADPETFRIDFLPFYERTVQRYGVLIDHIYYFDDVLRMRVDEPDPENPKNARKFIFRRDPVDVSVIYFWDPDSKNYREIPYAHLGRPPASLWEVRTIVREQNAKGNSQVDENIIFEGILEMREVERLAAEKKKTARRNQQKRQDHEDKRKKNVTAKKMQLPTAILDYQDNSNSSEDSVSSSDGFLDEDDLILPFEDIVVNRS
ncbi:transposase [Undibacterium amnicola]|uniref:Transposase n=1 Tax=Undibacterium amnicola TaxID=1834038 RepID=A0ABR6XSU4_9BURK|nr:Mu transposase C-terminal domain-containing protein [Undibacterium amnicola]MBC3832433.1 transposase [Undibacterium amnicola]